MEQVYPSSESDWLKRAKAELLLRDPVDAWKDAEALARFMDRRLDVLLPRPRTGDRSDV